MDQSLNEPMNQWINGSINQSMDESINQSLNQWINGSINQLIGKIPTIQSKKRVEKTDFFRFKVLFSTWIDYSSGSFTLSGVGDVDPSVGQQNGVRFLQIVRDVLDGAQHGQLERAVHHAVIVAGGEFCDSQMFLCGQKKEDMLKKQPWSHLTLLYSGAAADVSFHNTTLEKPYAR